MSVGESGGGAATADHSTAQIREAFRERERADSELRRAITRLLEHSDSPDLRSNANVALIRARVSRVRYAAVLSAAGWFVPEYLVDDVPER